MDQTISLPDEIRPLRQWLATNFNDHKKPRSIFKPDSKGHNDLDGFATCDEVLEWIAKQNAWQGNDFGIAFHPKGSNYFLIDLDGCRDPQSKSIEPFALEILDRFDSYCELSASKTGFHIICRGSAEFLRYEIGDKPIHGKHAPMVEVFPAKAVNLTGDIYDARSDIKECSAEINWLTSKYGKRTPVSAKPTGTDYDGWKNTAIAALRPEQIYGRWLTGKETKNGLECRDPTSPTGDRNPSAIVFPDTLVWHSHRTQESKSVFDFLVMTNQAMDFNDACRLIEEYSGVPRSKPAKGHAAVKQSKKYKLDTVPFSEIEPQEVEWLWPQRIAAGKLTLLCGEPGLGKTFVSIAIAATVSNGINFPDDSPCKTGDVLFLTCEDGAADTIRPRLDAHNADVARVHYVRGVIAEDDETNFLSLSLHIPEIKKCFIEKPDCKLFVIDPLSAFLGGGVDSHKDASVRSVLGPLCDLAEEYKVAILGITHLSKKETKSLHRIIGSIAFTAAARAAWLVEKDPDDPTRRFFLPVKNNLGVSDGLAFRLANDRWGQTYVDWEPDPVQVDVDDIQENADGTKRDDAKSWLLSNLEKGSIAAAKIYSNAKKDGFSERTLNRAKKDLPQVQSRRLGTVWEWYLPDQDCQFP